MEDICALRVDMYCNARFPCALTYDFLRGLVSLAYALAIAEATAWRPPSESPLGFVMTAFGAKDVTPADVSMHRDVSHV
jgi:hypothetical protein